MEIAAILARGVGVLFLLIAAGMISRACGIINEENARSVSNLVLLVVIPSVLIHHLQTDLVKELLPSMGVALILSIAYHIASILIANRCFRDTGDGGTAWRVSKLAVVFSNAGFMGFPLLLDTVGEVGLIYGVLFIGVFNTVSWIWCVPTLTGKKGLTMRQLVTNPAIAAFVIGILLYLLQLRLPGILHSALESIATLNTPLSMMIIGVFLAAVQPKEALRDPAVYKVILLRNLLIPLLTLLLLWAIHIVDWLPGGRVFAISFLIVASCPAATNTIQMSARYRCDSVHGAKLVAASTAVSLITLPLILLAADRLL